MFTLKRKTSFTILAAVCALFSISGSAQTALPGSKLTPAIPKRPVPENWHLNRNFVDGEGDTSEKSISVVDNVNFSMCVMQGTVKVNGWKRSEVRVFVKNGSRIGIKVLEKDAKSQNPAWIRVVGLESAKGKNPSQSECVWGQEVEIDVPVRATINIKGNETETSIDTVKRAKVEIKGGDISLRNVSDGINATTWRGGVTVENSHGAIALESTTGNIVVFEAGPREIGDTFRAKTNSGMISLQRVEHRQVEVNSISGSVSFNGPVRSGGSYGFTTSNGSIRLIIPQDSSCRIAATYGYGNFNSEIPMKMETENYHPGPVKRIVGLVGNNVDTTLRLTTNNGSITIKKQ